MTLDLAIPDRCRCDFDQTIKNFKPEASSIPASFGEIVAWVDGKVVGELDKEYQCSQVFMGCGQNKPLPELWARDVFVADDPVVAWLQR